MLSPITPGAPGRAAASAGADPARQASRAFAALMLQTILSTSTEGSHLLGAGGTGTGVYQDLLTQALAEKIVDQPGMTLVTDLYKRLGGLNSGAR